MPVPITCPHCGASLHLPQHLHQGPGQCPTCKGAFAIRWPDAMPTLPQGPGMPTTRFTRARRCSRCAEPIDAGEDKCPACGNVALDNQSSV
jgi:Zn-finger nucleic acid-binding protein